MATTTTEVTFTDANDKDTSVKLNNEFTLGSYKENPNDIKSIEVKATLKSIEYDKAMYEHGFVKLTFKGTYCTQLSSVLRSFVDAKYAIKVTVEGNTIAEEYYLHKINISNAVSGETVVPTIVMMCYSPDHKFDLHPGSKAWTGKKFGGEILANNGVCTFKNNLKKLSFIANGKDDKELPMPYLVQYNESFFDFACRTANRCGEFLYFEKGELQLGIASETAKSTTNYKPVVQSGDFCLDTSDDISITDITSNYANEEDDPSPDSEDAAYDSPFADDSFITPWDDKLMKINDIWGDWVVYSIFADAMQGESFEEVISNAISSISSNLVSWGTSYGLSKIKFLDKFNESKYEKALGIKDNYDLGGETKKDDQGKDYTVPYIQNYLNEFYRAIQQLEQEASDNKISLMFQNSHDLILGNTITVDDYEDTEYIVTRINGSISWSNGKQVSSRYAEAVPKADLSALDQKFAKMSGGNATALGTVPIPPLDRRDRVRKAVPQEAIVYDNADPLYLGRVRVQYLWQNLTPNKPGKEDSTKDDDKDSTANATPWIRISTPFAGDGDTGGMMMTPVKESRVMINYMHDNIEEPYVDGALFTKASPPDRGYVDFLDYYMLPDNPLRTIASANGQSISFMDKKGMSNFWAGMVPLVGTVCNCVNKWLDDDNKFDKIDSFNGSMALRDAYGVYEVLLDSTNRSISITSSMGKVDINAFTGINISAPNGDVKISGKNVEIKAGDNLTIQSGANIVDEDDKPSRWSFLTVPAGIMGSLAGQYVKDATKGLFGVDPSKLADFKFLRCVYEVIMRPVEGSLKLSSNRNVLVSAGNGSPSVPNSNLSHALMFSTKNKAKSGKFLRQFRFTQEPSKWTALIETLRALKTELDSKYESVDSAYKRMKEWIETYSAITHSYSKNTFLEDSELYKKFIEIIDNVDDSEDFLTSVKTFANEVYYNDGFILLEVDVCDEYLELEQEKDKNEISDFVRDALSFLDTVVTYVRAIKCIEEVDKIPDDFKKTEINNKLKDIYNVAKNKHPEQIKENINFDDLGDISVLKIKQDLTQDMFKLVLDAYKESYKFDYNKNKANWAAIVNSISVEEDESHAMDVATEFLNEAFPQMTGWDMDWTEWNNKNFTKSSFTKLLNIHGHAGPRAAWEVGNGGGIFMSSNEAYTYSLNSDGSVNNVLNSNVASLKATLSDIDNKETFKFKDPDPILDEVQLNNLLLDEEIDNLIIK